MPDFFRRTADYLNPATLPGAIVYALLFLLVAILLSRLMHLVIKNGMKRVTDPTGFGFVDQLLQVVIFLFVAIAYAQLVPALRALGTAVLAGVSIASIVIGLAAQNTLGNLVAGVSILLYRPFRVGDWVQLNTPRGVVKAKIETIMLGYTFLRDEEDEQVIVPNSLMAGSVIIRLPPK